MARDYDGRLEEFSKLSDLNIEEKHEEMRIEEEKTNETNKYTSKREKKEKELSEGFKGFIKRYNIKKYEDLPTAGAFVTFNSLKDKVKVSNILKNTNKGCCRKKTSISEKYMFRNKILRIS